MCVQRRILQTYVSNGWCIDQWHHLFDIVDQQSVEEIGVVLLQGGKVEIFVDICAPAVDHP
jgi:hypothetical protein